MIFHKHKHQSILQHKVMELESHRKTSPSGRPMKIRSEGRWWWLEELQPRDLIRIDICDNMPHFITACQSPSTCPAPSWSSWTLVTTPNDSWLQSEPIQPWPQMHQHMCVYSQAPKERPTCTWWRPAGTVCMPDLYVLSNRYSIRRDRQWNPL